MKLKFSENLSRARREKGLTQSQLASQLSVTPQAVSKWEKGSYPDSELLPEISRILGVSLDVLFGLRDEDPKADLTHALLDGLRQLPDGEKGKLAMELFYAAICAYNPNTSPESAVLPESFKRETFAHLRTDHELAIARLNPDMQYCCFFRIPEDGINSYVRVQERSLELFRLLSEEDAVRIIGYAETLGRNYILTKDCIARELDIPYDRVSDIVDRFDRLGIMWKLTANTGGEPFPIFGYVHNIPLVGILTLGESLVNYIACREPDIDVWERPPFRNNNVSQETQEE
ncbi:MAG: helix-turn-helix domain-containing protein [Ruminococcus sp.]|nr:helix-turn-helix domain-containing protein [Ruminococcus sp.]